LPVPDNGEKFSIFQDVKEFDILGPGIPLFFYFMQYMIWYLVGIFIIIYIQFMVNFDKVDGAP
jgi:hypothetical protein